jgi:hypothetical protein
MLEAFCLLFSTSLEFSLELAHFFLATSKLSLGICNKYTEIGSGKVGGPSHVYTYPEYLLELVAN